MVLATFFLFLFCSVQEEELNCRDPGERGKRERENIFFCVAYFKDFLFTSRQAASSPLYLYTLGLEQEEEEESFGLSST